MRRSGFYQILLEAILRPLAQRINELEGKMVTREQLDAKIAELTTTVGDAAKRIGENLAILNTKFQEMGQKLTDSTNQPAPDFQVEFDAIQADITSLTNLAPAAPAGAAEGTAPAA